MQGRESLNMNIYILYRKLSVGGAQLLVEKLSREFINRNNTVTVFYCEIDAVMHKRMQAAGAVMHQVTKWHCTESFEKLIIKKEEAAVITFVWPDYLKVCSIKSSKLITLLYAVHYKTLAPGTDSSFLRKNITKKVLLPILYKGIKSGNIFGMDEQTTNTAIRYYNNQIPRPEIVRIPVNCVDVMKRKTDHDSFNILSIARAEFPFKGYLLGLVDLFAELKEKHPRITLTIVSFGRDIKQLEEKIESVSQYKDDIVLIGKTDFDMLEVYYRKADIYIGMGTTILDAAVRGILSLPVVAYEEKVYVSQWFHENPFIVAVEKETQELTDPRQKIEEVISMDNQEYQGYAELSHRLVTENYSTSAVTRKILEIAKYASPNRLSLWERGMSLYINWHYRKM